ncbi:hypothetical protein ES703_94491 [subsurface metagenome]
MKFLINLHFLPRGKIPDATVIANIPATSEATPTVLDTRQFPPLLLRMSEVAIERDDDLEMRFKVDDKTLTTIAGSMFDLLPNNFSLLAKSRLFYNIYNRSVGAKTDVKTFFSLWVIKATVAHKLRYNIPLTPDEQKLNRDLGISDTVEKGLLPLPLKEQISREYQIIQEETHSFLFANVPTAGVYVETLHPLPNQFLVLTKISADCGAAVGRNIRVAVDRDYVSDYVEFPSWALGIVPATSLSKEISCFIPALKELRIKLKATGADVNINVRFTVWKCAMTNLFRARWGLATRDELPGDTYDKVMAGVL